jgi:hypothetical protein
VSCGRLRFLEARLLTIPERFSLRWVGVVDNVSMGGLSFFYRLKSMVPSYKARSYDVHKKLRIRTVSYCKSLMQLQRRHSSVFSKKKRRRTRYQDLDASSFRGKEIVTYQHCKQQHPFRGVSKVPSRKASGLNLAIARVVLLAMS